ncbi:MAG TPA: hemerythrin domain-containing protein [Candidatus Dormibacteraeota bacterium]|jgi:hemerythrin superfamily protein
MDAIELLTRDHRAVEELFSQFDGGDDETRRTAAEGVIRELSIHAAIEEEFFYPMVKKEVPEAADMVDHGIEEHQEAKQVLAKLDEMIDKAHTKAYAEKMQRLEKLIGDHVEEEENELFPKVREALTKTRLNEVGTLMNKAKKAAPTRPHPNTPANPLVQATAGKAAAVVDRMRDAVSGRTERR